MGEAEAQAAMALGEESDSTRWEAWRRRALISVFCPREEGEPSTPLPLPSALMLEGECKWMLPEPTSDRSPITCPASLQLLSIEALSMSVPVRRATTLLPAVSCNTLNGRSGCQHSALQTIASEHVCALWLERRFEIPLIERA